MAKVLISETVLEKIAAFAVGCALLVGGAATGGVATLAAPGAALLAVLGAIGLRLHFKDRPAYEQAWKDVLARLPREFEIANEADAGAVREAAKALGQALDPDALFSVSQLEHAITKRSKVVDGLIEVTIENLARRDRRFAKSGLPKDFANDLLNRAFSAALEASSSFRELSILVVSQETLSQTRKIQEQLKSISEDLDELPTREDLDELPTRIDLKKFTGEIIENIKSALSKSQATRGTSYTESFFVVTFDNGRQTVGASIDNRGRIVATSYGHVPTQTLSELNRIRSLNLYPM